MKVILKFTNDAARCTEPRRGLNVGARGGVSPDRWFGRASPGPSVPPGCLGPGVGVKKIIVRPYSPPAKLKSAAAPLAMAILDSYECKKSKLALASVARPRSGYEHADTS